MAEIPKVVPRRRHASRRLSDEPDFATSVLSRTRRSHSALRLKSPELRRRSEHAFCSFRRAGFHGISADVACSAQLHRPEPGLTETG